MLATVVDWGALGQVASSSLLISVALATLFTGGLLLVEPAGGAGRAPAVRRALGGLLLLACLALVAVGLYVVFTAK
jgi:hypothetical protein